MRDFGLADDEYRELVRIDRFGDSLRRFAQPQIGEKLPERESARHARSDPACAARARRSRLAAVQPREHGGRGRASRRTKWSRKIPPSTGIARTTIPTRAPRNSANTWCANCCRTCRERFSVRASCSGDSRRPETKQFDMVRAFVFLAGLPALPFRPTDRIDIVPVDYVAEAIATIAPEGTNRRTRFITCRRAQAPRHFRN